MTLLMKEKMNTPKEYEVIECPKGGLFLTPEAYAKVLATLSPEDQVRLRQATFSIPEPFTVMDSEDFAEEFPDYKPPTKH